MRFIQTKIAGLVIIEPAVFSDSRGYFMESYQKRIFLDNGIDADFVQENISFSRKGTLRGLHFQRSPHSQGKLVRVTLGCVYDVAVDLRAQSATFGRFFGLELSEENHRALYIPPGFAHGFYALSDRAQFSYKCTAYYAPHSEGGVRWNDPTIGVPWPLDGPPLLSLKDEQLPLLADAKVPLD
ncbi:MAG: dTDP-4-dehydrorhamnose 3,5-epimerase [bacterium ADurb.Bin478]|nr:MAG: dTDP-4-dehydrorhamnose 3,5-epimerase [bacterium ADurb.Bin478]